MEIKQFYVLRIVRVQTILIGEAEGKTDDEF